MVTDIKLNKTKKFWISFEIIQVWLKAKMAKLNQWEENLLITQHLQYHYLFLFRLILYMQISNLIRNVM